MARFSFPLPSHLRNPGPTAAVGPAALRGLIAPVMAFHLFAAILLAQLVGPAPVSAQEPAEAEPPGFPERAALDLLGGIRDLGADGWHVVSVPARMDGGDVGVLAGVLGVGGLLYVWDEGMSDALRRQEGHALHDGLRDVGDFFEPMGLMGNTNRWYALGVVAGYLSGWDPLLHASRDLLASHWLAAGTYNPPRSWLGRSRPYEGLGARAYEGGTSMPSGHASSIVQVAAVLAHHVGWKPASVVLWTAAGTVLLQRVDSGAHWPSDVWIGAAWGYGVTRLILARAEARREGGRSPKSGAGVAGAEPADRGSGGLRVAPYVDAVTGARGLAFRMPVGSP